MLDPGGYGALTITKIGDSSIKANHVSMLVIRSTAANNVGAGVYAANNPFVIVRITQSVLLGNGTGWFGATLFSYGDNSIESNYTANDAPPPATKK